MNVSTVASNAGGYKMHLGIRRQYSNLKTYSEERRVFCCPDSCKHRKISYCTLNGKLPLFAWIGTDFS